jgi:hypothetical protein
VAIEKKDIDGSICGTNFKVSSEKPGSKKTLLYNAYDTRDPIYGSLPSSD